MIYPIGMIPYTNMAPYREMGPPKEGRFVTCLPRDSVAAIAEGRIMAAAVPVGGLPVLGDRVQSVDCCGIAACGESMSVLLFSDRPFSQLDESCTIRLTKESASSVRLLYLLLGYSRGFDAIPRAAADERCQARLIIGDTALRYSRNPDPGMLNSQTDGGSGEIRSVYVTDLAEAWYRIHRLPFVFARWMVRRDAPPLLKQHLRDWLTKFRENEAQLVERCAPKAAIETGFPSAFIRKYLRVIRRSLGPEDMAGERCFLEEFETHKRSPLFEDG